MIMSHNQLKIAILTTPQGSLTAGYLAAHLNVVGMVVDTGRWGAEQPNHQTRPMWRRCKTQVGQWLGWVGSHLSTQQCSEDQLVKRASQYEQAYLRKLDKLFFKYPYFASTESRPQFVANFDFASEQDIELVKVDNVNNAISLAALDRWQVDLAIVVGSRILKPEILQIPRLGVLNKHASMLPRHRGLAAEYWCLYHEDFDALGVTVHYVDQGMDTGPIVLQQPMAFCRGDTPKSLRFKSNLVGRQALVQAVKRIEQTGTLGQRQDESLATQNTKPTAQTDRQLAAKLARLWQEYGNCPASDSACCQAVSLDHSTLCLKTHDCQQGGSAIPADDMPDACSTRGFQTKPRAIGALGQ